MLKQYLMEVQAERALFKGLQAKVGETGIEAEKPANAAVAELRTQRAQRMRRRYQRSLLAYSAPVGWVTQAW